MTTIQAAILAARTLSTAIIALADSRPRTAGCLLTTAADQIVHTLRRYLAEYPDIPDKDVPTILQALDPPPDRAAYVYTPNPDSNLN